MKTKTILIIILTALVTIILMKNADEVNFWIFGDYTIPKLAILGTMFLIGVVVGWMLGRPKKKKDALVEFEEYSHEPPFEITPLDEEDKDYIR